MGWNEHAVMSIECIGRFIKKNHKIIDFKDMKGIILGILKGKNDKMLWFLFQETCM